MDSQRKCYAYADLIMAGFVAILLCSNLVGVVKVTQVGGFAFSTGNLFFPLSYLFGDVVTEVYGYGASRRMVWTGFAALLLASFMSLVVVHMPAADGWGNQKAVEEIFGKTWRVALSSLVAFWAGEFVNSYTLAKMKILTSGKHLWTRTIGSTIVGEAVDTAIFYPLAGLWSGSLLGRVMVANYILKVAWEVLATPVTYRAVRWLKRAEGVDHYDVGTDFSPFRLRE